MGEDATTAADGNGVYHVDQIFAEVYAELKRMAHRRLGAESGGHTLNTTALVNETYLRLAQQRTATYVNRAQFFALAATAMRRILVDYARRHKAQKRDGNQRRVSLTHLDEIDAGMAEPSAESLMERAEMLVALDRSLEEFLELDPRAAQVVECRVFLGMKNEEIAESMGVTTRTVGRDWARALAWLLPRLRDLADSDE